MLLRRVLNEHSSQRFESFVTKNKKLRNLKDLSTTKGPNQPTSFVPVVNLTDIALTQKERDQLSLGLDYSFVDKNKHIKKTLAANFECVADKITPEIEHDKREDLHEFLRAYTDIFTKNVYKTRDDTYHNLKNLIN